MDEVIIDGRDFVEAEDPTIHPSFIKPAENNFAGSIDFGKKVTSSISHRNSDTVSSMYLYIELPELDAYHRYVQYVGETLIKRVEYEIGGMTYDNHDSNYLHAYGALNLTSDEQKAYHRMIGHIPEVHSAWGKKGTTKIMIPLRFSFCKYPECEIPVKMLSYHEFKINVEFAQASEVIQCKSDCSDCPKNELKRLELKNKFHIEHGHLIVNHRIFTGDTKRVEKLQPKQVIPCDTIQHNGMIVLDGLYNNVRLNFNCPVKEIIMMFKDPEKIYMRSRTPLEDKLPAPNTLATTDIMESAKFSSQGHDVLPTMGKTYYNTVQPYEHHVNSESGIYSIANVKRPESLDSTKNPSGSWNHSKIDNSCISLSLDNSVCRNLEMTDEIKKFVDQLPTSIKTQIDEYKTVRRIEMYVYAPTYVQIKIEDGMADLLLGGLGEEFKKRKKVVEKKPNTDSKVIRIDDSVYRIAEE